jgi:hypothetical protein
MERIKTFVNGGRIYPADLNAIQDAVPTLQEAGHGDFLQAGVSKSTDWSFTATINSGTAALGSEATTGGIAWIPNPSLSGGLVRTNTTPANISGLIPSSLPSTGKFMTVGFELSSGKWNSGATVTVISGIEKTTEAEAIAAPPAITANKIRIRDVVIKNTAGVYSIVFQRDRRAWSKGGFALRTIAGEFEIAEKTIGSSQPSLAVRLECSGFPVRVSFFAEAYTTASTSLIVTTDYILDGVERRRGGGGITKEANTAIGFTDILVPAAGSHLFTPVIDNNCTGAALKVGPIEIGRPTTFTVEEIIRASVNNGTT